MESGFDFRGEFLYLNKHHIRRTRGSNPLIKFDSDKDDFYCTHCKFKVLLKDTFVKCGNCKKQFIHSTIKKVGKSLCVCSECYKQILSYKAFDIFNLFKSSLKEIGEIKTDSFHDHDWKEILSIFGGEDLSTAPLENEMQEIENSGRVNSESRNNSGILHFTTNLGVGSYARNRGDGGRITVDNLRRQVEDLPLEDIPEHYDEEEEARLD
ncbi:MAG: hypothetical protein ACXAC2_00570 [Candidatus Kariarchaeaceae archaeon]